MDERITYLGWIDPTPAKKKSTMSKLQDAMARYEEKNGRPERFCLTSPQDAAELHDAPIEVVGRGYIARHVFYIGESHA